MRDDETDREGLAKYIFDEAMVVGDDAYHGTAACDYRKDPSLQGIRISASIYIADVNQDNLAEIMSDDTTIFPVPEHEEWYWASQARHWSRNVPSRSLVNDVGRKPLRIKDKWDDCQRLVANGHCDTDIWNMRAHCLKACRVLVE